MTVRIGEQAPDLSVTAYVRGERAATAVSLADYKGRWIVLFFYPRDFTFVCPTEIAAFAEQHEAFAHERTVLLGASTDSYYSHKAWFESDSRLADVRYPVLADTSHALSDAFGVLRPDGATDRGTFIIDSEGRVRYLSIHEHDVGRSVGEVLRVLQALRTGALCPAEWRPGAETLTSDGDWLAQVFASVPDDVLATLADRAERVTFGAGETIVAQGEAASRFFVVARGELELVHRSAETGDETALEVLGPGESFGRADTSGEEDGATAVRAIGEVELLALDAEAVRLAVESDETAQGPKAGCRRQQASRAS